MIRRNTIHLPGLLSNPAKEVPATNHNRDLHSQRMDIGQLCGDFVNPQRIHTETLVSCQGLTGELEQDALEYGCGHQISEF